MLSTSGCGSESAVSKWIVDRNPASLSRLIEFYQPLLLCLARKELTNRYRAKVSASDIVQETLFELATRYNSIRAENQYELLSYLHVVIRRKILNVRRYLGRAKRKITSESCLQSQVQPIDPNCNPIEALIGREQAQALAVAVSRLPTEAQSLLYLRFHEGLTFSQIGKLLDRNENAVRMAANRALEKLNAELYSRLRID